LADSREGIHGKLIEGKTLEVCGDSMGMPLPIFKGMFLNKNGKLVDFQHLALKDGSGYLVVFGNLPAILIRTDDMNREAARILDDEIDMRRKGSAEFDAKYKYYQSRMAQDAVKELKEERKEQGLGRKVA